jgi:hypothetical protein
MKANLGESDWGVTAKNACAGFGRADALGVLAAVAILGALTLSGSSTAKTTAQAIQCLENGNQLMRAWSQYALSNGGWLAPNQDDGAYGNWLSGSMTSASSYNDPTNYGILNNTFTSPGRNGPFSAIGNYFGDYRICKCPADTSLGSMGGLGGPAGKLPRVRSYSMSQAVGTQDRVRAAVNGPWLTGNYGANTATHGPFRTFGRLDSFISPGPSATFVVMQEDPYSINDAGFANSMTQPDRWIDYPASVHNDGDMFAFADGHCVIKQWVDRKPPVVNGQFTAALPNDPDVEWLRTVTTARLDGAPLTFSNPSP